ncbi:TonB-dependent receptor plug [Crinalium epipsammum PCC 9333]|uniref:TonB-dependent receptor plug n=1 Tax=Crinalium epipsammum PCC 9333 TaxID=1173022 RepID=K9VT74_9CYAN|nr:TonB-dependent receptor [Crinalium epipsammum]AFZ11273.1 TonB-dependent receptor plug [Crinalium epipsammum PCC 9333]
MQKQLVNSAWMAGVVSVIIAQPVRADIAQITNVRVNPTAGGLEIILETADRSRPQVILYSSRGAFVADIIAQLRIPQGTVYSANSSSTGITSVTVSAVDANTTRLTVTGNGGIPTGGVNSQGQGLIFSLTPATAVNTAETQVAPSVNPGMTTSDADNGTATSNDDEDVEEIVVTASRRPEVLRNVSRSVTVIPRAEIEQQTNLSRNLTDVLGKFVPGLGAPTQTTETNYQSMRGRSALILIDGIPQNANTSTAFANELRTIDPSAIERIEVVRGASATYGNGATGGVINIITRRATEQKLSFQTDVSVNSSLSHFADSLGNSITQSLSGKSGNVDYTLSLARTDTGSFFDANGDRIPNWRSNLDNTENYNILGKLGVNLDSQQRLQLSANYFKDSTFSDYISDTSLDDNGIFPEKARAIRIDGLQYVNTNLPGNLTNNINLDYSHQNIFGSRVQAQAYYRTQTTFDQYGDVSLRNLSRTQRFRGLVQGELESEKLGARLQIETPLSQAINLLWGVDYSTEDNSQNFNILDKDLYTNSGNRILRATGDTRTFTPLYNVNNIGFFAQLQTKINDKLTLNGGVRNENIGFSVDDYTSIFGANIKGGSRNVSATVFNVGTAYNATDAISVFADFSQGFSIPDLGRVLRNPPDSFVDAGTSVNLTEPQKVNSYEVGVRGNWRSVKASLAAFYNNSDLGSRLVVVDPQSPLQVVRTPERFYGLEGTVDVEVGGGWQVGGTATLSEGEFQDVDDNDGDENTKEYLAFDVFRVQPTKLTAYLENKTTSSWSNRLQVLYVGDRNRAFEDGTQPLPIKGYMTVDYISSIKLGRGMLQVGVENLLNKQYFAVQSQDNGGYDFDSGNAAARGRSLRIGYALTW